MHRMSSRHKVFLCYEGAGTTEGALAEEGRHVTLWETVRTPTTTVAMQVRRLVLTYSPTGVCGASLKLF